MFPAFSWRFDFEIFSMALQHLSFSFSCFGSEQSNCRCCYELELRFGIRQWWELGFVNLREDTAVIAWSIKVPSVVKARIFFFLSNSFIF